MNAGMTGIQDRLKMCEKELKDETFSEAKMVLQGSSWRIVSKNHRIKYIHKCSAAGQRLKVILRLRSLRHPTNSKIFELLSH